MEGICDSETLLGIAIRSGRRTRQRTCLGRVKLPSKPSILFPVFSVFPITWGICSPLDGQPQQVSQIGF
jgi:hypothetical protein